jgi:prevent-host-death family protein
MMTMVKQTRTVSKSRFKARALAYFRDVEQTGRPLVITDRGTPVLKLVPFAPEPEAARSILRDTVVRYEAPMHPVADDAWEASR